MIAVVAGTRPEIIKLAPVYRQLQARGLKPQWLYTGQQPDLAMETFEVFSMIPDVIVTLNRHTGLLGELHHLLSKHIHEALLEMKPVMVVVQGDTLSAAIGSQQAFLMHIPCAHVEAGLRSFDVHSPYPEEASRVWIDSVADLRFAPTATAATQARSLSNHGQTYVTGNTAIDALRMVKQTSPRRGSYAVVTLHRRENAGDVAKVCQAVKQLARNRIFDYVVWPVHPNPNVRDVVPKMMKFVRNVECCAPLPYDQMVNLVRGARLLLTDSGGLQEEALGLHVPVLVLRKETERPEGIAAGGGRLVGTDCKKIVGWATWLATQDDAHRDMADAPNPYGDGKAAERIAYAIGDFLKGKSPDLKRVVWDPPKVPV